MNESVIINWAYSDYNGLNEKNEKAAVRKLLKNSESFDDAKFTFNAAVNCIYECAEEEIKAIALAAKYAKRFDEYIFVMAHSLYGTPQYEKAAAEAEKKAKSEYELKQLARLNIRKSGKHAEKKEESPITARKKTVKRNAATDTQLSFL